MSQIKCSRRISAPKNQVFEYMLNPKHWGNLLRQHIDVELQVASEELKVGNVYKMTMTRMGLSQPVELEILNIQKNTTVTYKQSQGLFAKWIHTQNFEDVEGSETLVTDIVEYQLPLGLLGHIADDVWVRQDMKRILEDRLYGVALHFS